MTLFYVGLFVIAQLLMTEPGLPMSVIPVISTDGV